MNCPKFSAISEDDELLDMDLVVPKNKSVTDYSCTNMPRRYWGANFTQYPAPFSQKLNDFALGKTDKIFMVLEGGNGTGKTYNSCSCIGVRMEAGLNPGNYLSCKYTLCPLFRSSRLTTGSRNEIDTYSFYYDSPFNVLDEVGKGDDKILEKTVVSNLISAGYDNEQRYLISTNMTMTELCKWLGEDINSRFYQCAEVITINECDYRKK